ADRGDQGERRAEHEASGGDDVGDVGPAHEWSASMSSLPWVKRATLTDPMKPSSDSTTRIGSVVLSRSIAASRARPPMITATITSWATTRSRHVGPSDIRT